jgi:hypothetical protein
MRATIVAFLIIGASGSAVAQPVDDNKLWSTATAEADVTRTLRLEASEELRTGSTSGFDEARTEVELGVRPTSYLGFAAVYVLIVADGDPRLGTADETRHRLAGDTSLRIERGRFGASNRVRLQYTTHEAEAGRTEIRDKIRAGYEVVDHVTPYAAVELFYLIDPKAEYRETRWLLGVDWRLNKRFELGAFYLRQDETNVQMPEHNNILGFELTYMVRRIKKGGGADHD